jgi:hypothetical protein
MSSPIISNNKIMLLYIAWWCMWGTLQVYLQMEFGIDFNTALKDALVTQLIFAMAG